jgi:TP901 family phage tail tape measure protein
MTVGEIVAVLKVDATQFRQGLAKANSLLEQNGALATRAATMLAGFSAAIVGAFAYFTKQAVEFEAAMRNVNSILKQSEENYRATSAAVLALAGDVGQAPAVLARGLYDIVSSGFEGADALQVLEASARAATAGLTDTATASRAIVATLNAYGMGADEVGRVSDVLFKTVERGVVTFGELSQNLGEVISTAAQARVPIEDVGAAIATMTKAGIQAPEAVTSLNQVLLSFIRPTDQAREVAKQYGIELNATTLAALGLGGTMKQLAERLRTNTTEIEQLIKMGASEAQIMMLVATRAGMTSEALAELFPNVRALRGALALAAEEGKQFSEDIEAMAAATGSTAAAFAEQGKAFQQEWAKTWAGARAFMIKTGADFIFVLQGIASALKALITLAEAVPQPVRVIVAVLALVAAGLAAVTAGFMMWNTQMAGGLTLAAAMTGAMAQMTGAIAAANVQITIHTFGLTRMGAGLKAVAGYVTNWRGILWDATMWWKKLWIAARSPGVQGLGLVGVAIAIVAIGTAALNAAADLKRLNAEFADLQKKARQMPEVAPEVMKAAADLKPTYFDVLSEKVSKWFGIQSAHMNLYRQQVALAAGAFEVAERRKAAAAAGTAALQQDLLAAEQGALKLRLEAIDKQAEKWVRAGRDEVAVTKWAEREKAKARGDEKMAVMRIEAEILEAQGKSLEARLKMIDIETAERVKSLMEAGRAEQEAMELAEQWAKEQRRKARDEEAREEKLRAEERIRRFEDTAGSIVSTWRTAADNMRRAGRLQADDYAAQMVRILQFIEQINEAQRQAGQAPVLVDERRQAIEDLGNLQKELTDDVAEKERRLQEQRRERAREQREWAKQLHDYEMQMHDLAFQHRRDLLTVAGELEAKQAKQIVEEEIARLQSRLYYERLTAEERLTTEKRLNELKAAAAGEEQAVVAARIQQAQINADELRMLQQKLGYQKVGAEEQLDVAKRLHDLIMEMARAGELAPEQARAALQESYRAMEDARKQQRAEAQKAHEETLRGFDEALGKLEKEKTTLLDYLQRVGPAIQQIVDDFYGRVQQWMQALSAQLEIRPAPGAAAAGAAAAGGQRIFNIYFGGREVGAPADVERMLEEMAKRIERATANPRN